MRVNSFPEAHPILPAIQWIDLVTTLWGVIAVLLRLANHQPGLLNLDMLSAAQTALPMVGIQLLQGELSLEGRLPLNGAWPCYNLYTTADGKWMVLAALEPTLWASFCRAAAVPELCDKGFDTRATPAVAEIFSYRTQQEWIAIARKGNFCLEPVLTPAEAVGLKGSLALNEALLLLSQLLIPIFMRSNEPDSV